MLIHLAMLASLIHLPSHIQNKEEFPKMSIIYFGGVLILRTHRQEKLKLLRFIF